MIEATHTGRFQSKHKNISNIPKSWSSTDRRRFFEPRLGTQLIECSFPGADPYPSVDMKFHFTFPGVKQLRDKMKHRELEEGELIKEGDEWRMTMMPKDKWHLLGEGGIFVGMLCHPTSVRIRRKAIDDGKTISS